MKQLADAGIEQSVGSGGGSYDNAMADLSGHTSAILPDILREHGSWLPGLALRRAGVSRSESEGRQSALRAFRRTSKIAEASPVEVANEGSRG